jgi:integrase
VEGGETEMSILRTSNSSWAYDFWHLGKRFRKRFKSRDMAIQAEAKKRLELGSGLGLSSSITFRQAAQLFLENHAKPNKAYESWQHDASKIEYLHRLWGDKKLADFTPLDIQGMRNHLSAKGLTSRTADRYHSLVKSIFNKMVIWRKFEGFNPANGVKLKREPNAHIRFLCKEEIQLLESHLRATNFYPYFIGALHTGMRRGELCSVQWEHVTFPMRDIYIPKSKSGKSRHVPMSDVLHSLLKELYGDGKDDKELVFGTVDRFYLSHCFKAICQELGIKDFRFHDLRHTFASQLVMAGVSIFKVSKWLGHSSVTTTEKYYAHLSLDSKREEINCLNRLSDCYTVEGTQTNNRQTLENVVKSGMFNCVEN